MSQPPARRTLAWASYLASSWTWCIGMFLPVLLMRDFGWWGFAVFAVPNILGAAAMGWVLSRPGASEAMVARHGAAMRCFSVATIAFQVFFAAAVLSMAAATPTVLAAGAATFAAVLGIGAWLRPPRAAGLVTTASLLLAAAYLLYSGRDRPIPTSAHPGLDAALLLPATCLGFLLCPYLDLTFHRARQSLDPAGSKLAFGLGFAAIFPFMILFTAAYAALFLVGGRTREGLIAIVAAHMLLQTAYTSGLHARELAASTKSRPSHKLAWLAAAAGLAAFAAILGWGGLGRQPELKIGPGFERAYRAFMGLYGLMFPAYLLVCIGGAKPARLASLAAWGLACLAAAPFFWMAFVQGQSAWAPAGVGVVAAAGITRRWMLVRGQQPGVEASSGLS